MKPGIGSIRRFVADELMRARAEDLVPPRIRTSCHCGKPLDAQTLDYYDEHHDAGTEIRIDDWKTGKRWLFFRCSCGCEMALQKTKITVPKSLEEIEAALGDYDEEETEIRIESVAIIPPEQMIQKDAKIIDEPDEDDLDLLEFVGQEPPPVDEDLLRKTRIDQEEEALREAMEEDRIEDEIAERARMEIEHEHAMEDARDAWEEQKERELDLQVEELEHRENAMIDRIERDHEQEGDA